MTELPTVSRRGQTTVILCSTITIAWSLSNDDRKSTVFSLRRNVVSDGAFLTDDGRLVDRLWTGKPPQRRTRHPGLLSLSSPSVVRLE